MMISPEAYIKQIKSATYEELINEREALTKYITAYERSERAGDRSDPAWQIHPMPDVRYQCYLEYLSLLCSYMKEKYNQEYVWGEKKLSDKN